jgi:nicotinate-nucleotide--dimethylbenzimidazole phosphoribosyltransferase
MSEAAAPDLDLLGRTVSEPDLGSHAAARERLEQSGLGARMGRLADLAAWWAAVRGDATAAPPSRTLTVMDASGSRLPAGLSIDRAVLWGIEAADRAADSGVDLLLMAVDDDPGARLVTAELLDLDPVEASGWPLPQGLDDEEWMDQVLDLRDGLRRTRGTRVDLAVLLSAADSPALAAAAGLAVQAAVRRTPILLDGEGALAAALLARRASFVATQWWQVAQARETTLVAKALQTLQLEPLVSLGLRAQDGTGARLGLAVLAQAAALLGPATTDA